ncbi:MAG: CDP-glycerol glycerophosphotransferase family protein [Bacteroidales bacterium]|nr:CDP-glycerol glycerophosphotransferase family protein [Bacteroidales bacterium]
MSITQQIKSFISKKGVLYNAQNVLEHRDLFRRMSPAIMKAYCKHVHKKQEAFLETLKGKECVEVAFFLTTPGMWKCDYLFRMMQQDKRYHPYVVIHPYSFFKNYDESVNRTTLERTRKFIEERGFEYVIPFDEKRGRWYDIKKTLNPDVIFFCSPYKDTLRHYYIYHYADRLSCYVQYAFCSLKLNEVNYNLSFHNALWRNFEETETHLKFARKYSLIGGPNAITLGYPGVDVFLDSSYVPSNKWKMQDRPKKRIIWAPHHTIQGSVNVSNADGVYNSNFIEYCEFFLELAKRYESEVQFAFKPHQVLRMKLNDIWGKEKTDAYYEQWDSLPNGQLEESDYRDLFLTSDAMIHDCGSFTTEYLHVHKPVMYLVHENDDINEHFNEFGVRSYNVHYHGYCKDDIEQFVKDVIHGDDRLKKERDEHFKQFLQPPHGNLPSQNIFNYLNNQIFGE